MNKNPLELSIEELRNELLLVLFTKSYSYSKEPIFELAYKEELSNFYINSKKTTYDSRGMWLIGNLIYRMIKESSLDISAIGGLTLGADAIANSTALISTISGIPLNAFTIRKEQKTHGSKSRIEGAVKKGDNVLIVDDVVTTGTSTINAIKASRKEGLIVNNVIVLVDRQEEEQGLSNIEEEQRVKAKAIFTANDLRQLHEEKEISEQTSNSHPNQQWAVSG